MPRGGKRGPRLGYRMEWVLRHLTRPVRTAEFIHTADVQANDVRRLLHVLGARGYVRWDISKDGHLRWQTTKEGARAVGLSTRRLPLARVHWTRPPQGKRAVWVAGQLRNGPATVEILARRAGVRVHSLYPIVRNLIDAGVIRAERESYSPAVGRGSTPRVLFLTAPDLLPGAGL